ncbi:MAG TPA: AbrB/MazE/SpoVT family DNA-binding domain-containing protein [Planctomycetota bacterium]|nr:AbrB/MazE/SpoVT family DNA-binding domain-containing protein [Planctomycetota bacterium]HRR78894.1 AbrB/MazE/SpoVT family DNA-binding domain-containing protein [Planctomycetota bacterium]HRT93903.1 AbrB/MazE/SpoVT family DNA-binding domain-containing protein [Planctomycetota bacterium]
MAAVTVSPKYQIVIPKEIREPMGIRPGQKIQMMRLRGHVVLVPVRDIGEMRGFLKGMNTDFEREEEDRL